MERLILHCGGQQATKLCIEGTCAVAVPQGTGVAHPHTLQDRSTNSPKIGEKMLGVGIDSPLSVVAGTAPSLLTPISSGVTRDIRGPSEFSCIGAPTLIFTPNNTKNLSLENFWGPLLGLKSLVALRSCSNPNLCRLRHCPSPKEWSVYRVRL